MISYLKGTLTFKSPTYLIVETGGVGYQVFVSLNTYSKVQHLQQTLIHTIHHVTETAHTLYGFAEESEKELFTHLISVSGVGPATARLALSSIEPLELKKAIVHEDLTTLQRVKGVGAKSAKRIVLELKDKLIKLDDGSTISAGSGNTDKEEALSALVALGFNKATAEKAIDKIVRSEGTIESVEQLIKLSLKSL